MQSRWRSKLIRFKNSPQVKRTDFSLEEVYVDEGTNINTVSFYDAIDTLLFYWRFNLCEKKFKFQGDKEHNDFEIEQFKQRANQFLAQVTVGEVENMLEYYDKNYPDDKMINYLKEKIKFNSIIGLKN
jgi:hypothetical protein